MADLPRDGITLAFDTSGPACCAAILDGGAVLVQRTEEMARGQAERLIPLLEDLLDEAGCAWTDVGLIAVGTGPGNFTGIRISVAAARGLALSLGCPAVGVSTLEALAHGLPRPCVTVVPARRGAFYVQRHDIGGAHDPRSFAQDDLAAARLPAVPLCGAGAADLAAVTGGTVLPQPLPLAVAIAHVAQERGAAATDRPRPLYLRAADAAPASDRPPAILTR